MNPLPDLERQLLKTIEERMLQVGGSQSHLELEVAPAFWRFRKAIVESAQRIEREKCMAELCDGCKADRQADWSPSMGRWMHGLHECEASVLRGHIRTESIGR